MPKLPPHGPKLDRKQERQEDQGARLHRLRRALGISQTKASEIVGVTLFKWHKMEHGQHPIDPLALQIFCEEYGIGADYVILATYTTLPPVLRGRVLEMEDEELQQVKAGKVSEKASRDIRRRLGDQTPLQAPLPPAPNLHGRRKRKREVPLVDALA
jgi:transcriptional regulator with XRE-family HTH domain